jgi:S-adenosylmethionine-diacylglycerol 3-amino-3-carboxypropyl transferase
MPSEIEQRTRFDQLRYAQCWEDADILLAALAVQPHHTCLSIASGGENTLALLSQSPQRVIAVDLSPAQIASLELKVAAFAHLSHGEMLVLLGSWDDPSGEFPPAVGSSDAGSPVGVGFQRPEKSPTRSSTQPLTTQLRTHLYRQCRPHLSPQARQFWDDRPQAIAQGINGSGKFERYLALFRRIILPLVHAPSVWQPLLTGLSPAQRDDWYRHQWDSWRWRSLFRAFFSRFTLGHLGTDPQFLRYGESSLADHLLQRTRYALTTLDPAQNPYLHWILLGHHQQVLPYALRPENFDAIRTNLPRLEWHTMALEDFLNRNDTPIDRGNLSNVFEYMSQAHYQTVLNQLHHHAAPLARLAYWNRLSDRTCPPNSPHWHGLDELATHLHQQDQVFFYQRFVILQKIAIAS